MWTGGRRFPIITVISMLVVVLTITLAASQKRYTCQPQVTGRGEGVVCVWMEHEVFPSPTPTTTAVIMLVALLIITCLAASQNRYRCQPRDAGHYAAGEGLVLCSWHLMRPPVFS